MKNLTYSILASSLAVLFTTPVAFAEGECGQRGCSKCNCEEKCDCGGDHEKCTCKDCQCTDKECGCKDKE